MNIVVRRMQPADVPDVAMMEQKNFSIPWSAKAFLEALEKEENIYVVALVDGKVAGYIGSWTIFNEVNITNVCVDDIYRKNGIGKQMMQFLLEEGKKSNKDTFMLEVRVHNAPAIALYESIGFERVGVRKNLYEQPQEDGLVMNYTC